ncbi:hypothetical protein R1flu_013804 [Riccia fluitans]|uniref:Uncharacterized protein n=1 Tax=Riccia fluitans TaxID=41844 RepID=A0ABD1YEA3_9MARC
MSPEDIPYYEPSQESLLCTSFVDETTLDSIRKQGGIQAIAVTYPHELYSYVKWAVIFNSPVYIHERDKGLVAFDSEFIETWKGEEFALCTQIKSLRLGARYDGAAVLH